jgi:myo-inositol 2-dehydrogenase/D-chiro-inositol 1-dehydrogenase
VRLIRAPRFKAEDPAATLVDGEDALVWEPNLTVAADDDHKGYRALLAAWLDLVAGRPRPDAPTAADGVAAMRLLEAMVESIGSARAVALQP